MATRRILMSLILCAISGPVLGSPRSDPTTGRAVFTGATVPHPTSVVHAPAALGLGTVNELYFAVTSVIRQIGVTPSTVDINTGDLTPGPHIDDVQLAPGGMIAWVGHPSSRITLGAELRIPPSERFLRDHDALRYH